METSEQQPIACCLGPSEYKDRIAWIESLTRHALCHHARNDLVLSLSYTPDAEGDVRRMVNQERICCAFLKFDLDKKPDAITMTITAPEAARDSADALFQKFHNGVDRFHFAEDRAKAQK